MSVHKPVSSTILLALGAWLCLLAFPSFADDAAPSWPAWFREDGSYQRRREEKVAVLSPANLAQLQGLVSARDAREEELVVLVRLLAEKQRFVADCNDRFAREYGIRQDRSYNYDAASMTLYYVCSDPRHGGSAEKPVNLPHRVFPTEEEAQAFLALMNAKNDAMFVIRALETVRSEKEKTLRSIYSRMEQGYPLRRDRSYRLEEDSKSVFMEYVAPRKPTAEEVAAKKAAEEAAAKKTREDEKARLEALRAEAKRLAEEKVRLAEEDEEHAKARREAIRMIEKEKADLEARELARAKEEAKERAAEELKARRQAEKLAKEKARLEEEARRKAEVAERARAEAARRAEKERLAKAKEDEALARKAAVESEKNARSARIAEYKASREAALAKARESLRTAERKLEESKSRVEEAEKRYESVRKDKSVTDEQRGRVHRILENAEKALENSRESLSAARLAAKEAERKLSRFESDAQDDFDKELRAQGKEPLVRTGWFFW